MSKWVQTVTGRWVNLDNVDYIDVHGCMNRWYVCAWYVKGRYDEDAYIKLTECETEHEAKFYRDKIVNYITEGEI